MTGQPPLDLDLSSLPGEAIVYDLVYSPLRTGLLGAAEARGLDTVDGLDMLIGQAALAFQLFFGPAPPQGRHADLRAPPTACHPLCAPPRGTAAPSSPGPPV